MPPHAERNTPDHAHKSQDRSIRLPASSCTTTICRSPSRGVDGLRSHPRASRGRSMQDPASELPRIPLPRRWVNRGIRLAANCFSGALRKILRERWLSRESAGLLRPALSLVALMVGVLTANALGCLACAAL